MSAPRNIERHTAHIFVPLPNPKQWIKVHTSGLTMTIRQCIYYLNQHKGDGKTENIQPDILVRVRKLYFKSVK